MRSRQCATSKILGGLFGLCCLAYSALLVPSGQAAVPENPAWAPLLKAHPGAAELRLACQAGKWQVLTGTAASLTQAGPDGFAVLNSHDALVLHVRIDASNGKLCRLNYQGLGAGLLILEGTAFDRLHHRLEGPTHGVLDLDADGNPELRYQGISQVFLNLQTLQEIQVETLIPAAPMVFALSLGSGFQQLRSADGSLPATFFPRTQVVTLLSAAQH